MANEPYRALTPVGRLVQGHPMEANPVMDERTKQAKLGADGKPLVQYYMALAFPKSSPEFAQLMQAMQQIAMRDWPQGQFNAPTFAWKIVDGDGRDKAGKPYADRVGFAGHYVLKMASGYPYQVVDHTGQRLITDTNEIKRGYFMRAYVSIKGNSPSPSPGLYVNVDFAQLIAFGEVINSGPDIAGVLRNAAPIGALPPGATMTPQAPAAGPLPIPQGSVGGMPQQQPQMMPQAGATPFAGGVPSAVAPNMMQPPAMTTFPSSPQVQPHPGIMMPGLNR